MACAEIINVDHTGLRFWIPTDKLNMISGPNKNPYLMQMSMIPVFGSVFDDIVKVFQRDGPYGKSKTDFDASILGMDYSSYSEFYENMSAISNAQHKKHLIDKYIPMIEMKEKLEQGITVLDVGCGVGFHMFELGVDF